MIDASAAPAGADRRPAAAGFAAGPYAPSVARLATAALVGTFGIIFVGAQVTTTLAGDSVPTWPASFFFPRNPHQWAELGHRWIAGPTGVLAVVLGCVVARRDPRAIVRKWAVAAAVAVVVQALVGGRRVLLGETHGNGWPVLHTLLGQTFLAMTTGLALVLGRSWNADARPAIGDGAVRLERRARALLGVVFAQAFLGAILRHVVQDRHPAAILAHAAGAVAVVVAAFLAGDDALREAGPAPRLRKPALTLFALLGAQLLLGISAWAVTHVEGGYRNPQDATSLFPTLHVLVGAGILSVATWLLLEARRAAGPRAAGAAATS